jgi:hypothetical protein
VNALTRLRELPPELRNAGIAAAALAVSLILPWYQKSYFVEVGGEPRAAESSMNAFGVFSFVEAAVLLVASGVLFLVWARSERKGFHLPGGDGTAITLAGGWALLLLIWRLFDKPDVDEPAATVGIQWGIFAALAAAGALLAMGLRVRAVDRPEPPNPAAEEGPRGPRPPRRRADPAAVTDVLGERPDWSGEPPEAPGRVPRSEAPTQRSDEAPTRRSDEAPTRRSDEAPTRVEDDDRLF